VRSQLKNWLAQPLVKFGTGLVTVVTIAVGVVRYVDQQVADADKHELTSVFERRLADMKSDGTVEVVDLRGKIIDLQRENGRLQNTLDGERSRIVFTIEQETNSLDRRTLVLPAERIPADYKVFATEGFAVPAMVGEGSWQWHDETEHIIPGNSSDATRLDLLFPKPVDLSEIPDALKLAGAIKVASFADPASLSYFVNGKQTTVTPQVTFELLRWSDYDMLMSIRANAATQSVLEFAIKSSERLAGNLRVGATGFAATLANDLLPLEKPSNPNSPAAQVFATYTAKDLATVLMAADPRVADEVVAAYAVRLPGEKAVALEASLKEQREQWTKLNRSQARPQQSITPASRYTGSGIPSNFCANVGQLPHRWRRVFTTANQPNVQ
jgi:hypothetical protein